MNTNTHAAWVRTALEAHEERLLRYAQRITGNVETARDVVQDTFMQLCMADPAAVDAYLLPWLYRVCRNRAFDVMKKERRMEPIDAGALARRPSAAPPPGRVAEGREEEALIWKTLAEFPENQQEVFRLKFQEALSYKEISQVTGYPLNNVRYLLHTALKRMRETLGDRLAPVQGA